MSVPAGKATVIVKTYGGAEADTILAQAEGYRLIMWEVMRGEADRDPVAFRQAIKIISQKQAEKGA